MIDVIIPAHRKDVDTIDLCIEGIRKNVKNVNRVIVVSKEKLTDKAEFYNEKDFPFSIEDVGNIVGFHNKTFNYYGGLIQTTAALVIPDLSRDVLICDADTIFLKETEFVTEDDIALFNVSYDVPKNVKNHPYIEHLSKLIPGLTRETEYSGICHHMLIQSDILRDLAKRVEEIHNMPFWKADIYVTRQEYNCIPKPKPTHDKLPLLFTTYELYFNYAIKYFPERVAIRPQKSILSYKGRMGVEGEDLHNVGSRTNLSGNVQIIPKEEEAEYSFSTFAEACRHISPRCEELGWDAVTFQNHTRIGTDEHKRECDREIHEICKGSKK